MRVGMRDGGGAAAAAQNYYCMAETVSPILFGDGFPIISFNFQHTLIKLLSLYNLYRSGDIGYLDYDYLTEKYRTNRIRG